MNPAAFLCLQQRRHKVLTDRRKRLIDPELLVVGDASALHELEAALVQLLTRGVGSMTVEPHHQLLGVADPEAGGDVIALELDLGQHLVDEGDGHRRWVLGDGIAGRVLLLHRRRYSSTRQDQHRAPDLGLQVVHSFEHGVNSGHDLECVPLESLHAVITISHVHFEVMDAPLESLNNR